MAFNTPGFFGHICPYHETDPTQYGPGTSRPAGFKLAEMMMLFWQATDFIVESYFGSASYKKANNGCGGDGSISCDCNAFGSGGAATPSNPRTSEPVTMSKIMCGAFTLTSSAAGTASASVNMTSIASDTALDTPDKWHTALFYPQITISLGVPDDGTSDCSMVSQDSCLPNTGDCNCAGAGFQSGTSNPLTAIPSGAASWSGPGSSFPVIDLYGEPNPDRCGCENYFDVCNGGADVNGFVYGSRQCGPLDGTDCPLCLTNDPDVGFPAPVCGDPGAPPPPDCNQASCQHDCLPKCCGNGCGGSDTFAPPCTVDGNGCSPENYSGGVSVVLAFTTNVQDQ